jgi:hypothetical protein
MSAFGYILNITGTCENGTGAIQIVASGGTAPYTFEWYNPDLGLGDYKTGLSSGIYQIRANDSTAPVNLEFYINAPVSSGMCLDIISTSATTCGISNGSLTVSATSDNSQINYYLYSGSSLISGVTTNNNLAEFNSLSPGIYSVQGVNAGGCSATTETCIIYSSSSVDYGFYIVNDTECASPTGKLYITGVTGNSPFTYLWFDGTTGTSVTGLTQGTYEVTVTSSDGCSLSQTATIDYVPGLGLGSWSGSNPTCFSADGALTLTITGGTGPYLYSGSNGTVDVTYAYDYTFSGLSSGPFSVSVTDAALCKITLGTTLIAPQSFYDVVIQGNNSTCSSTNGSIDISLQGGTPPFTYTLVKPDSSSVSVASNFTTQTFSNLVSGDYTVFISDNSSCGYSQEVTLIAQNKYTVSTSASGTTCGQDNGSIRLTLSTGGTAPYLYSLSNGNTITTSNTGATFSSLAFGTYVYTVTDYSGCVQTGAVTVTYGEPVNFSLYTTGCGTSGTGGTITTLISSGTPPFTFDWSDNVSGNPQNIIVSGLTGGTYSVTIVDASGCTQTRTTTISCNSTLSTYQIYTMCESDFEYTSGTKRGILQMLNEGFNDLTSGNTQCILSAATYTAQVDVSGVTYQDTFYTGTTLLDVPTDQVWYDTVETLLESIPGVSSVNINTTSSVVTIQTDDDLANQQITIELIIDYDIHCVS